MYLLKNFVRFLEIIPLHDYSSVYKGLKVRKEVNVYNLYCYSNYFKQYKIINMIYSPINSTFLLIYSIKIQYIYIKIQSKFFIDILKININISIHGSTSSTANLSRNHGEVPITRVRRYLYCSWIYIRLWKYHGEQRFRIILYNRVEPRQFHSANSVSRSLREVVDDVLLRTISTQIARGYLISVVFDSLRN